MSRLALTRMLAPALLALVAMAGGAEAADSSAKPSAPYMDLQPIGFPAIIHGRLVNYVFADVRLMLGRNADAARLQDQEPFLRDALVRAATRTPFNPPQDGVHLDEPRLKAEVMRQANALLGPGKVLSVDIRSQTPQRRSGVPGGLQP